MAQWDDTTGRSAFGAQLRRHRRARDLTQQALAARASCSVPTVKKLEQGLRGPSAAMVSALVRALGLPAEQADRLRVAAGHRVTASVHSTTRSRPGVDLWTTFVGRTVELQRLAELLDRPGIVCIHGPGGVGKSRLAAEYVRGRDDVVWVGLQGLLPGDSVAAAVAASLDAAHGGDRVAAVAGAVTANGTQLVVLDNCEHVAGQVRRFGRQLLRMVPELRLLLTSRTTTGLPGVARVTLHGLDSRTRREPAASDAVSLFLERAERVQQHSYGETDLRAIASLCERLDGLPLAIELAAAQTELHSPKTLAEQLGRRRGLQQLSAPTGDARHHGLADAVQWSVSLLDDGPRATMVALAHLRGPFTLTTAEQIAAPALAAVGIHTDVTAATAALVRASLLVCLDRDPPTLRMLRTIRDLAVTGTDASRIAPVAARHHAMFFADLGEEAAPRMWTRDLGATLDMLAARHDDFSAAVTYALDAGDALLARRLTGALARYWDLHGHYQAGLQACRAAAELPGDAPPNVTVECWNGLGTLALLAGDVPTAMSTFSRAAQVAADHDLLEQLAYAHEYLGLAAVFCQDHEAAELNLLAAERVARRSRSVVRLGWTLVFLTCLELERRNFDAARASIRRMRELPCGELDPEVLAWASIGMARVNLDEVDLDAASAELHAATSRFTRLTASWGMSVTAYLAGQVAAARGDEPLACQLLADGDQLTLTAGVTHPPVFRRWRDDLAREAGPVEPASSPAPVLARDLVKRVARDIHAAIDS